MVGAPSSGEAGRRRMGRRCWPAGRIPLAAHGCPAALRQFQACSNCLSQAERSGVPQGFQDGALPAPAKLPAARQGAGQPTPSIQACGRPPTLRHSRWAPPLRDWRSQASGGVSAARGPARYSGQALADGRACSGRHRALCGEMMQGACWCAPVVGWRLLPLKGGGTKPAPSCCTQLTVPPPQSTRLCTPCSSLPCAPKLA